MQVKFTDLFIILKETDNSLTPNLTEERIYSFCGDLRTARVKIPVFSGATQNKGVIGYVPFYLKIDEENNVALKAMENGINYYFNREGCLTIVADGTAGHIFYRDSTEYPVFSMNISTVVLYCRETKCIKIRYPDFDGLDLEWFYLKHKNYFKNLVRGEGVKHFTKTIYGSIELEIPKLDNQKKELAYLREIELLKDGFIHLGKKYSKIKAANLSYGSFAENEELLSNYLFYVSRNDFLTEEEIYRRSIDILNARCFIKVISGAPSGYFGVIPYDDSLHHIFQRPCIQMVRVGKAGSLRILSKDNYAPNSNCMLIYLRQEKLSQLGIDTLEKEVNYLHYIIAYLQPLFKEIATKSDLSVFPLSKIIQSLSMKFPKYSEKIEHMAKLSIYLDGSIYNAKKEIHRINDLIEKTVTYTRF